MPDIDRFEAAAVSPPPIHIIERIKP